MKIVNLFGKMLRILRFFFAGMRFFLISQLTSPPKSKESGADGYKTPSGRVDISDVIRRKKEARAAQAQAEKGLPAKDLPLPKKDKKER